MLPKGSEEDAKAIKEEITSIIKSINSLLIYGNKEEVTNNILKTKDYESN